MAATRVAEEGKSSDQHRAWVWSRSRRGQEKKQGTGVRSGTEKGIEKGIREWGRPRKGKRSAITYKQGNLGPSSFIQ